jgi:hypothetical protein
MVMEHPLMSNDPPTVPIFDKIRFDSEVSNIALQANLAPVSMSLWFWKASDQFRALAVFLGLVGYLFPGES